MSQRYPIVRTVRDRQGHHPDLSVQFEADKAPIMCCGDSWCGGRCGLPALVMPDEHGVELKAYSDMTACGPLMQSWRLKWTGPKVEVPVEHREDFGKRWWR